MMLLISLIFLSASNLQGESEHVLRVGVHEYPPYVFVDSSGKLTGFDAELITDIAKSLSLPISFKVYTFYGLMRAVQMDSVDVAAGGIYRSQELRNFMDFTMPYMSSELVVVKRTDDPMERLSDLGGRRVAVRKLDEGEIWARKNKKLYGFLVIPYASLSDAYKDIQDGYIDALIDDYHHAVYYISKYNLGELDFLGKPLILKRLDLAIGVSRRKPELRSSLNMALDGYIGSDRYENIYQKWFFGPSPYYEKQKFLVIIFISGIALLILLLMGVIFIQSNNRDKLLNTLVGTARVAGRTAEIKNKKYYGHSLRVAAYTEMLSRRLGLCSHKLSIAAYLHDIGKLALPDFITSKFDPMSYMNDDAYREHPVLGYLLMRNIPSLQDVANWIRWHHERWDGKGYPDGLKEEQIPLESRIISVANAFDIFTTFGYEGTEPLTEDEARRELLRWAGIIWDPKIVTVAVDALKKVEIPTSELQVYSIIENIKLKSFDDIRKMETVFRITEIIKTTTELDHVMDSILTIVKDSFKSEHFYFIILNDNGELYVAAQLGANEPNVIGMKLPEDKGVTRKAVIEKRFVLVRDAQVDPLFVAPGIEDIRSELAVPLILGDKVIGVLDIESRRSNSFKAEDIDFLQSISTAIAMVIEVARSISRESPEAKVPKGLVPPSRFAHSFNSLLDKARDKSEPISVVVIHTSKPEAVDLFLFPMESLIVKETNGYTVVIPKSNYEDAEELVKMATKNCNDCSYGIASFPADGDRPKKLLAVAHHRLFLGGK